MDHTKAISTLANVLREKHENVYVEREVFQKPCWITKKIPDITIEHEEKIKIKKLDIESPLFTVIEIGNTSAEKIIEYGALGNIREIQWFTRDLELAGSWKGNDVNNNPTNKEKEICGRIEALEEVEKSLKRSVAFSERTKMRIEYLLDKYSVYDNERLRILCPSCLELVPMKEMKPWFSQGGWGTVECKSCQAVFDFPGINSNTYKHPAVKIWQKVVNILQKIKRERILYCEIYAGVEEGLRAKFKKELALVS